MKAPVILAIETATEACSVAIVFGQIHTFRYKLAPRMHTKLIFPMIQELLDELSLTLSDLSAIAVGQGPGSFTGVRIAISCAQGLGYALGIPIFAVSTLAALKAQVAHPTGTTVIPALDARMGELYVELQGKEMLCRPENLAELINERIANNAPIIAVGSGWDNYPLLFKSLIKNINITYHTNCFPQASEVAMIAYAQYQQSKPSVFAHQLVPHYIRNEVAQKTVKM